MDKTLDSGKKTEIPFVTLQEKNGETRKVELRDEVIGIGRDEESFICLADANVSRHHARFVNAADGIWIEDLGSRNGTFVNSAPVVKCMLKHLDVIQIGAVMMIFNDPHNALASGLTDDGGAFTFETFQKIFHALESNIAQVFKGKSEIIRNVLVCLMADGHLLLEDAPGVGKSMLAQALAKSIQSQYRRIQFTPDMLPSDITGSSIYDESTRQFRFVPGPVFGNVILADEINRTTPRTQASLLECMSEGSVTVDGWSHVLPKPFFVAATQNPGDYHGTYPLPEPQLDRFMMRLSIGYPSVADERAILDSQMESSPLSRISYVVRGSDVVHCIAFVRKITVSDPVKDYIISLVNATREHEAFVNGCSPRATLALMRCAQSLAACRERQFVTPGDVRDMVKVVFAHRLHLKLRMQKEFSSVEAVLDEILQKIPLPDEAQK